jgi:hypothetical protein
MNIKNIQYMTQSNTFRAFALLVLTVLTQNVFAQNTAKVWVTISVNEVVPVADEKGVFHSNDFTLNSILENYNVSDVSLAFSASKDRNLKEVYEFSCDCNPEELKVELSRSINGISNPEVAPQFELMYTPNDYNLAFSTDYALDLIGAQEAWDLTLGNPEIVLGISDANYISSHPELEGIVDYLEPNITNPNTNHGTCVAITAAGNTDNNYGKSSIGANCHLQLYSMGYNQILNACYNGAKVINMSWASSCSYNSYCQSVIDEIYNNGVVLVAAAGNGGTCGGPSNLVYPSAYNHVISVTSIGSLDNHENIIGDPGSTHQHNATVDIAAPGYNVALSNSPGNYFTSNGTSFASPIVTGTIGLMLSVNPCLTPDQVETILKETAVNIDALNPNYIGLLGAGRLNAAAAVLAAKNLNTLQVTAITSTVCEKDKGVITISASNGVSPYTVNWEDGSNDLTSPELAFGTYEIVVTDAEGCHATINATLEGSSINYDYVGNLVINSPDFEFVDNNGDGLIKVGGTITIASNINYEIADKKLQFGYGTEAFSGIIIQPGANLTLSNHTLLKGLSACQSKWDGIIVMNNIKTTTGLNETGDLTKAFYTLPGNITIDHSSIHDALTAVTISGSKSKESSTEYKCGNYVVNNGVFVNNNIAFDISSEGKTGNTNSIEESIFITDDSSIENPIYILTHNVNNLSILKNGFFGNPSANYENRGVAISSISSNLMIASNNDTDLSSSFGDKGNNFYNLTTGIYANNEMTNSKSVQVSNSYFDNVIEGVTIIGNNAGTLNNNEFFIPAGSDEYKSYAFDLNGKNSLVVTENLITTNYKEQDNVYGMIIQNSEENNLNIYLNRFEGNFIVASLFKGDNLNTNVDCNTYIGHNQHDWNVASGTLANHTASNEDGSAKVYRNNFSECNGKDGQIYVSPEASNLDYQTSTFYMPSCVNNSVTLITIEDNTMAQTCQSLINPQLNLASNEELMLEEYNTSVYPNPTKGETTVNWKGMNIDNISIYNTLGELLMHTEVAGNFGQQEINNLSSGTYFIKLSFENNVLKTEKLVVSK